jgi:hypothetical protein
MFTIALYKFIEDSNACVSLSRHFKSEIRFASPMKGARG